MSRLRFYWAIYRFDIFKWAPIACIGIALGAVRMGSPRGALGVIVVGIAILVATRKYY